MTTNRADPTARWWRKVEMGGPEDCWIWTAALFSNGYGAFRLGQTQVRAHRFAYETFVGPIPEGLIVCHTCDVRRCVNPAHLFLGTHTDNAHDRERKGRGRYRTVGPLPAAMPLPRARGERHGQAKLTEADVQEIRRRRAAGESQRSVASRFGVAPRTVTLLVRRETWRHVP